MIQSPVTRLQGQKGMEKTMVVMVFMLLLGLSQASLSCKEDKECRRNVCIDLSCKPRSVAGGRCNTNSHCLSSADKCINEKCSLPSAPGGPCDTNEGSDCADSSSTCSATNTCLSPTNGQCAQNNQCALSSDSCIGLKCEPKAAAGGTCDANDGADCAVASSTCSASNTCLSPANGQCSQNDQCASSSDSCIGQTCKPKAAVGGTCDTNDNADCVSGKCSASSCAFDLSPFKWEGNKAMSIERTGAASVSVRGFLFVFGGSTGGGVTSSVEMYNPSTNTWVPKADIPVVTQQHSVVAIEDFVYLIGGANNSNKGKNYFYRYDTVNDKWTTSGELPVFPDALHSMAATVVGTTIFTFGGQTEFIFFTAVSKIYSFDTANPGNGWTTTNPSLPFFLTQASAVSVGSMIYITGGIDISGDVQTKTYKFDTAARPLVAPQNAKLALTVSRNYHASFFNPTSNKIHLVGGVTQADKAKTMETLDLNNPTPAWTAEPSAILNQIYTPNSGGLIGSRIYLPGTISIAGSTASSLLYVLDISSTPEWVPFAASPTPSFNGVVAKVGSSIISAGGILQTGGTIYPTSKYDISSDTWSSVGVTLSARNNVGSAVVGSEVYSLGGSAAAARTETYALNAAQTAWVQKANMNVGRYGLCAASEGTKIYAYGGYDGTNNLDAMEIYDSISDTWTDVTTSSKSSGNSPTAMYSCAAVSTGTKILIFGGAGNSGFIGKVQSFDIATEKWDPPITSSSLTARFTLSATVLNGYVIVTGGTTTGNIALATVEAYEISTGLVTSLPDMPSPRLGHGSVTDGDSVIVVGGLSGGLFAPIEKFRAFP